MYMYYTYVVNVLYRHIHYKNNRIQNYSQTVSEWIISLNCSKLDSEIKNKTKEHVIFTLRFTS